MAKKKKEQEIFDSHPIRKDDGTIDIEAEQKAILKEMKRLGLRK